MTKDMAIEILQRELADYEPEHALAKALKMAIEAMEQEHKIKVLDRDEAIRELGAVDVYQASAWITLLNDLEYLGLKICEVEE